METDNKDVMPEDNWTEKQVERYFCKKIEELGCQTYKFVSPGCVGVPDRIVILPGGRTWFVELKRAGEELRPIQKVALDKLTKVTKCVTVLHGKEETDAFISCMRGLREYGWSTRKFLKSVGMRK